MEARELFWVASPNAYAGHLVGFETKEQRTEFILKNANAVMVDGSVFAASPGFYACKQKNGHYYLMALVEN